MTMNHDLYRRAALAGGATAALLFGLAGTHAQTPTPSPASPPAATEPSKPEAAKSDATKPAEAPAKPSPGEPGKAAAETPTKPATDSSKPADPANPPAATPAPAPPAATEAPVTPAPASPPPPAASVQPADPFGEEITLAAKGVVILKGSATWDNAFESLVESLKTLAALLDKQGIKPAGNMMIVYTSTDDSGFTYQAEIPTDQEPKNLTKAMSYGKSPEGRSLKFVHRGSYDNMDNTYEAITNHLDDKKLEAKDTFIEEYITDPLKTAEDKLIINVYVPLK